VDGIRGRVVNVAFLGNHSRITVATDAGDLVVLRPHGGSASNQGSIETLGEEACVWWPADEAAVVGAGDRDGGGQHGSSD
jgi:hypothetical protein